MEQNGAIGFPFRPDVEKNMKIFYDSLSEKDKRHYAALEAQKLIYGGITYIADLLGCDRSTIHEGMADLKKNNLLASGQIRHNGGGRKNILSTQGKVEEAFLKVIDDHIAGDPMNEKIRWVKLTHDQICQEMSELGEEVSRNIVRQLLKKHKFVKRKMQRKKSTGKSQHREEQFQNIIREKAKFMRSKNPIISMDTKKKELIGGDLYRSGSVYSTQAIEASDHDYSYLADLKIAPHGIYDLKKNKAYINIGTSFETAEFICDSLERWWLEHGKNEYQEANKILIFCDAGGANSYRHHIFKVELQKLANKINIKLKIVHYPPYTSKWNPIEHRVFPHVTRAMAGVPLNSTDDAKKNIELAKTKTGLSVIVDVIRKNYKKGKEVAKDYIDNLKIKFEKSVPQLNYTISPNYK